MNRKRKKQTYIRLKNSWRNELKNNHIIEITTFHQGFPHNPRYPLNKIIMDFLNRNEIVKFGVKKINLNGA